MGNDMYGGYERLVSDGCIDPNGNIINQDRYNLHMTPRSGEFLIMASLDGTIVDY